MGFQFLLHTPYTLKQTKAAHCMRGSNELIRVLRTREGSIIHEYERVVYVSNPSTPIIAGDQRALKKHWETHVYRTKSAFSAHVAS